jgi:hypothetical protein
VLQGPKRGQWPGVSVFVRDGDQARHLMTQIANYPDDEIGCGLDPISPVWNVFDLLSEGRGDWLPSNQYPGRDRG